MKKILIVLLGIVSSLVSYAATKTTTSTREELSKQIEINLNIATRSPEKIVEEAEEKSASYEHFQTGVASHYGAKWNGRKTASGEIFNTNKLTAAHKTLPFNSKVRVTNLSNGKSVIVRITDRGPYAKGRVIDLSQAAFSAISSLSAGIAKVKLEIVK